MRDLPLLGLIWVTVIMSFFTGCLVTYKHCQHEALKNGAGYYEQMTGDFKFAPVPIVISAPSKISLDVISQGIKAALPLPRPPHKPKGL